MGETVFEFFTEKKKKLRNRIHQTMVRKALEASRYFIQTKQKKFDAFLAQHQINQKTQADSLTALGRRCFGPFEGERRIMAGGDVRRVTLWISSSQR